MKEDMVVEGYLFGTAADAALAKDEAEKIKYLDNNMNYSNTTKVLQLYDRALDTKMFKTPVGWDYLCRLREILLDRGYIEAELRPIPLYSVFARSESTSPVSERIKTGKKKADPYKRSFVIVLLIAIILAITVISMFIIVLRSDTPNMINYRSAIINEYAAWEQELKDREDKVREKEREQGIVSPVSHDERVSNQNEENLIDGE